MRAAPPAKFIKTLNSRCSLLFPFSGIALAPKENNLCCSLEVETPDPLLPSAEARGDGGADKQGEKAAMACAVAARFFHDERPDDGLSSRLRATPSSKEKRQSSPSHLEGARERETCRQHVLE